MISVAADTDAACAVMLPRCKAIPHTDRATATANAPFSGFILACYLLFLCLLLLRLSSVFTDKPTRCHKKP